MVQADDDGPAFSTAALTQVTVCPATLLQNGGFSYKRSTHFWVQKVRRPEDSGLTIYEVLSVDTTHVAVICKFVFSRRFSRIEWNVLTCGTLPPLKYSLLDSAARTGDVILLGGEGVEAAAHSAVLVDVPYFEAKLREEWSGTTAWNLHNKLRLRLPYDVSKDVLGHFLHYLYGETQLLYAIDPWASMLKEILSLADACGVPALCDDVIRLVMVTSANVAQWLPWLLQEHGSINVKPIQKQVGEIMRNQLQTALQGQTLTVEQLAVISMSLANPEGLLSPSAPPQSVANLEQTRAQNESGS